MKKLKQLMAMMLTAIMILSMAVTGFAAVGNGSLTLKLKEGDSIKDNLSIKMYKLYTLNSYNGKNYSYTINSKYTETLKTILSKTNEDEIYETISGYADDSTEINNFADNFIKNYSGAADKTATLTAEAGSVTIGDVPAGYYLVFVEGVKPILITITDKGEEINLKSEAPKIDKEADKEDVSIGEIVTYTITTKIPKANTDTFVYKITDTLSSGLDFVNFNDNSLASGNLVIETKLDDSATTGIEALVSGRTMTIDLSQYVKDHQTSDIGKTLTIKYKAKVNANAVVTEKNSASLEYGNNPEETITNKPEEVKTPTFPIHINKTDKEGNPLAGAKFEIYESKSNEPNTMGDTAIKIEVSTPDGVYKVSENQTTGNTEMTTVASISGSNFGKEGGYNLVINGLKAGNYWLKEISAPDGYNLLKNPIKITITNNGDTTYTIAEESDDATVSDNIITIINKTGEELPETGGMGTVLFTVIGAALIIMAGIRLARRNSEQE